MARKNIIFFLVIFLLAISSNVSSAATTLAWNASSGVVTGYRIYYGTSQGNYPLSVEVGNITQYPLSNLSLQVGTTYYFIVKAYNDAGESGPSNEESYTINPPPDTTPPLPPQGQGYTLLNGNVTISWQANQEPDIAGYRVYSGTSSRSYNSPIPVASNVTSYIFSGLQEGTTYYFAVSAVDTSDNESGPSGEAIVTIPDTFNPTLAITSPALGGTYETSTSTISIAGSASDNVGVTQVTWSLGASNGTATGTTSWAATGIALQAGSNVITITASDSAGNQANATLTVTYNPPDTTIPVIAITSPTASGTYETSAPTVSIAGNASDNVGVAQVTWSLGASNGTATGTTTWSATGIALQAGSNDITIAASDSAGNQTSATLTVIYTPADTTVPVIAITSPTASGTYETSTATISIAGSASDNVGVTQVTWMLGANSGTATGTTSWSATGIALRAGSNDITITASDSAGNQANATLTVIYTPADTTVPVVAITSPTASGTYETSAPTISIAGNASDNISVSQVTWSLGANNGTATGTTSWAATGITLQAGSNVITVTASDSAGNQANATLTVIYTPADKTIPVIAITSPTSSGTYETNASTISIAGSASDNIDVTRVTWSNSVGGSGTATGTTSWSIALVALQEGSNIITVTASDAAENMESTTIAINYTPEDVIAPVVSITSPTIDGTYQTSEESLAVSGLASDNINITQVTWSNSSGGSGIANGTNSWSISGIALIEGENIITVRAGDSAGNESKQTLTVVYQPEIADTTPPSVNITSPKKLANFLINTTTLDLSGTADDDVGVTKVTWENSKGGSGEAIGTSSWSIPSVDLSAGWNRITITAIDAAGNAGQKFVYINYRTRRAPKSPKKIRIR
jgi:hypothetical protein